MSNEGQESAKQMKFKPAGAKQHITAGPYSPVLEIDARRLVVISGQVAVDLNGAVVGGTIEDQTAATLDNCERQLATAGCSFAHVFKANIFLTDLKDWAAFNKVYEARMPEPMPVRTAVQTVLLPGFIIEIEMWATKPGIQDW